MRVSLIVAISENGVIGRDGDLPWRIPEDLKFFKATTMGKPIIMGRKTFESIGKPLPGRRNIVVTRDVNWQAEGVDVTHSLADALKTARGAGASEAMIIGGAQIYAAALPLAGRIYLTQVQAQVEGDVFFPKIDMAQWVETERKPKSDSSGDGPDYAFIILDRAA